MYGEAWLRTNYYIAAAAGAAQLGIENRIVVLHTKCADVRDDTGRVALLLLRWGWLKTTSVLFIDTDISGKCGRPSV